MQRLLFAAVLLLFVSTPAFAKGSGNDRVSIGSEITVAEGETAGDLVCVFCSIRVHGDVSGDVVAILGSVTVDAGRGIHGDIAVIGGDLDLGEGASIGGDVSVVAGDANLASGATIHGSRTIFPGRFWLLLPLIHFVLLGFLPLPGEHWSRRSEFAAGCGQFLMVRREAYFASKGHSAIRTTMHDGLLLPQLLRRKGFRTSVYDLSKDAVCRMYRGADEVWQGLAKNATEGMASPRRIPVFTVLLLFGQVLPAVVAVWALALQDTVAVTLSTLALELGYAVRLVSAWRYGQSWRGAALHPLGVVVLLAVQWYALVGKLRHRPAVWKQRSYEVG